MKVTKIIDAFPKFNEECGKAFRCNDRALFYAKGTKDDPQAEDTQDDPLSEIEKSESDPVLLITLLYSHGFGKLDERLIEVAEKHKENRRTLDVSDRDERAISKSRSILYSRFHTVADEIKLKRTNDPNANDSKRDGPCLYKNEWSSLNNMCNLMMDEITHLKSRTHDFQSIHRVLKAFQISIAALIVSIVIGFANLTKDFWLDGVKNCIDSLLSSAPAAPKKAEPSIAEPDVAPPKEDAPTSGAR